MIYTLIDPKDVVRTPQNVQDGSAKKFKWQVQICIVNKHPRYRSVYILFIYSTWNCIFQLIMSNLDTYIKILRTQRS